MALSYPLTVSQFHEKGIVVGGTFYDDEPMEYSRLGDGSVIKASVGAALWRGRVDMGVMLHEQAVEVEALLSVARRAGGSFFTYDRRLNGPLADPGGVILGASTPTIRAVSSNNRDITLENLPANYVFTPGDMLGFTYGSNPVRYALHRIVVGGVGFASGLSPVLEVTPFIREGVTTGTAVELVRPVCKAVIPQRPVYGAQAAKLTSNVSYDFIQTLR